MLEEFILPDPEQLHLDQMSLDEGFIHLSVSTQQTENGCPTCGVLSSRIHSSYLRHFTDLPFAGFMIRLHWRVRRFFCDNPNCPKVTFSEQIPSISRYARKTKRLISQLREIAFSAGGEPGARLAAFLKIPTSPDTLLRLMDGSPEEIRETPQYLGVDDWAMRKRYSYGTILVDLETHKPVDLLPERSAEALANWLKAHPGVKVISRDRSSEYAKGATEGAPEAIQVADRFHLLVNLREAVQVFFEQHQACLYAAAEANRMPEPEPVPTEAAAPNPEIDQSEYVSSEAMRSLTKVEQTKALRREKRLQRYREVLDLNTEGVGIREIARRMKIARKTVRKFIQAGQFPEMGQRKKMPTQITPYENYLEQRWKAGCHNRLQLWREISDQGFSGAHTLVYIWADQKGLKKEPKGKPVGKKPAPQKIYPWSASRAAWLLFKQEQDLKTDERLSLEKMKFVEPKVEQVLKLVHEFQAMTNNRQAKKLPDWLRRVNESGIEPLKSFGRGVQADRKAVEAALSLPWSNGVTEGNVNRLKMIKRQMFGRASFSLLRQRVLRLPLAT